MESFFSTRHQVAEDTLVTVAQDGWLSTRLRLGGRDRGSRWLIGCDGKQQGNSKQQKNGGGEAPRYPAAPPDDADETPTTRAAQQQRATIIVV